MEFEFADPGEIVRISTLRYRDVKGVPVLTPWAGRFREYVRIEGMMIPMAAEVDWITPEGSVSVWRGRIMSARYEFAP